VKLMGRYSNLNHRIEPPMRRGALLGDSGSPLAEDRRDRLITTVLDAVPSPAPYDNGRKTQPATAFTFVARA
jgi:hypothetical protein